MVDHVSKCFLCDTVRSHLDRCRQRRHWVGSLNHYLQCVRIVVGAVLGSLLAYGSHQP